MTLSNATYDKLKWIVTIFLPAVGALYFAIAQIWDFDRIAGVNGTINAIIAFCSVLLGISSKVYNRTTGAPDGDLYVTQDPDDGKKYLGLGVNGASLEELTNKETVTLKVVDKTETDPRMPSPIVTPSGMVTPPTPPVIPGATPQS